MSSNNYPPSTSATVKNQADGISAHADGIAAQLKDLVDTGKDKMGDVKDKIVDAKDVVVDKAGSMFSTLSKTIKDHPFISVGVGLGIGYFAMRLIRR